MSSNDRNFGWAPTRAIGDGERDAMAAAWQATRAQTALATQILGDQDEADAAAREIGKQISPSERELFVSCAAGEALEQKFAHVRPAYIVIHDVATRTSRQLLTSIAAAASRPLQKLVIRRQGQGTPLATIEYAELSTAGGTALRIYTTDCEADAASRPAIATALLAYSRLAVVIVGDVAPEAIDATFQGLRAEMLSPRWVNRDMLMLPLAPSGALSTLGGDLSRSTPVGVRTTPVVKRPADAWEFISGTWGRLGPVVPAQPPLAARGYIPAPSAPLEMRPMPPVPGAANDSQPPRPDTLIDRYVQRVCDLAGVIGCCVFDTGHARLVAYAGAGPSAAELAQQGTELVASVTAASRCLGLGLAPPELAVTLAAHHLLIKPVPKHAGHLLHVVLDKAQANLTLARLQLGRLDAMFDEAAPGA